MSGKIKREIDRITSYSEQPVWTTFPVTIKWMREQRDAIKTSELPTQYFRRQGMNATIILLSAACLEGFLVECLSSFAIGNRFASKDTFQGRLDHDFLQRISSATFGDFPDLFRLTLGHPISELLADEKLLKGVRTLIDFRNGIAHGRSVVYLKGEQHLDEDDYEIGNQYERVHEYLEQQKLIFASHDLFDNKEVADHFVGLIKPYMEAVVALLPVPQSDNVKALVKLAWKQG